MRNISTRFSVVRLLGIVRRHIRLLKQVFNAENLIDQIKPDFDSLEAKQAETESKNTARENAYDDMVLADNLADDAVRNLFDACQQFDRNNPGSNVTLRIFPDEKFGEIIRLPLASELLQIEKLVIRLKELGEGHSLSSYVTELQTKGEVVKSAIGVFEDSLHSVKTSEAEAEILKEALIRKYELNYLEARKTYGKKDAEKLFPKLDSHVSGKETEEQEQQQQDAA
jgi:hypothetical protein